MMKKSAEKPDAQLSFLEHLEELRIRLIRIAAYWLVGAALGWGLRTWLLNIIRYPAEVGAAAAGIPHLTFRIFDPIGGIMLAISTAAVAGFVFASPLILMELWLFIKPALKPSERGWFATMIPAATGFFLAGIVFAYWIMMWAFKFFLLMNESLGAEGELTLNAYVSFMLKVLPTTGLIFELPMVLMFLGYVGIVSSDWLMARWRHITVAIFILVAVFEPTNNPFTMILFVTPVLLLFFLSIWMLKVMERKRDKVRAEEAAQEAEASASGPQLRAAEGTVAAEPGSVEAEEENPYSYYEQMAKSLPEPPDPVSEGSGAFPPPREEESAGGEPPQPD